MALRDRLGSKLALYASPSHLDPSVRTGIPRGMYDEVALVRLGGLAFIQLGNWRQAIAADSTMLDLNPRSISAWALLVARRCLGRRTVLWGHLHSRKGPESRTARLRALMRRSADGFVAYTYTSQKEASVEGSQPVWVAPNSLYSASQLSGIERQEIERCDVVYVGRFEEEKKVDVAIRGFAQFAQVNASARLVLVGGGSQEAKLRALVEALELTDRVKFGGWTNSFDELRELYSSAFCALSPGFIGLGLTQALGFGVPMIASRDEPHSPEVELVETGGVSWFETDDPDSLAAEMHGHYDGRHRLPLREIQHYIADRYSAEAMAAGLAGALEDDRLRKDIRK